MSGSDRDAPARYDHLHYWERCDRALALRELGVPTQENVRLGRWTSEQALFHAISRARKPWKYRYKYQPTGRRHKPRAFGGTLVDGKAFDWGEWDDTLKTWVKGGMTRPQMAKRLSDLTGRFFTTNQVIGRIYRVRQAELKKRKVAL